MAILGIDEVGRGPWAGPLVVGAVVLSGGAIEGLTDSKKLTAKRRVVLADEIVTSGAGIGLGWVEAREIDELGLSRALKLATRRAVEEVRAPYHEIIIDGTVNFLAGTKLEKHVTVLAKADLLVAEVSAASIVAKVARDKYMVELSERYPEYGFEKHVGYGTAKHLAALREYGATREHRESFRPVKVAMGIEDKNTVEGEATTRRIGDRAEDVVVKYLEGEGHEILARNWKTRMCEIDIVSRFGESVYFTEVKYRRDRRHGSGLEVITREKQKRMGFGAESFVKYYKLDLVPILAVAEVSGDFEMGEWFELEE